MVTMANKRRDKDVMRMQVSSFAVLLPDETKMNELIVDFPGPEDSPYVGVSAQSHLTRGEMSISLLVLPLT